MKYFLILLIAGVNLLQANALEIVRDGKPVSVIIIDKNAVKAAKFAAAELQYHVKLITGAKLPIVTNASKGSGGKIYVGESDFTRGLGLKSKSFQDQEYIVRVNKDFVILMGNDDADIRKFDYANFKTFPGYYAKKATTYAVYHFIENLLGVRWYLPTEIGIVYDKRSTLKVPELNIRRKPFMKLRRFYEKRFPADFSGSNSDLKKVKPISGRESKLWYNRRMHGGTSIMSSHSFYSWKKIFGKSHPEYFAQGRPLGTQLCYSNPKLIAEVVKRARDYFDGKPNAWKYFYVLKPQSYKNPILVPLVPNDNPYYCKCAKCRELLKKSFGRGKGQFTRDIASEYIFTFINAVAKELKKSHPDKFVSCLAYSYYGYPPSFKLEDNVIIGMCLYIRDIFNNRTMKNNNLLFNAWKKSNPSIQKFVWIYYCYPAFQAKNGRYEPFPGFFADHIQKQFRAFASANVRGFFCEPSSKRGGFRSILMDQLEDYLTYKLADDPQADAPKLIDEFFARYYGNAGEAMKKFYRRMEQLYCDPKSYGNNIPTRHNEFTAWKVLGTPARMQELGKLIKEAESKTANGPERFRKRVKIFENGIWNNMLKGAAAYKRKNANMSASMQQALAPYAVNPEPGNPKAAAWNKAGYLRCWYGSLYAKKATRNIRGRLTHDGTYLYILIEDPVKTATLTNKSEWGDGCEFFLGARRGEPCYQIGAGHDGTFFIKAYGTEQPSKKGINIITDLKAPKLFRMYIAVPLKTIGVQPGQMLYFNVLRNRKNKNEACWIPTFGGHFVPQRNGQIYLEKVHKEKL